MNIRDKISSVLTSIGTNVLVLGIVSFFTDVSSEMIYPLLPVFFTGLVGASSAAIYIGLMDGIAESVSSLLKIYSGRLSDTLGKRKLLAVAGYSISALAKPLMAIAAAGWHVIGLRFLDRIGKGIRTSPRDALISESVKPEVRGLAFSFHRMMDHAGAVSGPVIAMIILYATLGRMSFWHAGNNTVNSYEMHILRWIFAIAFIPAGIAVIVLAKKAYDVNTQKNSAEQIEESSSAAPLPRRFLLYLLAVVLFTLGNSSDLFLVFYAQTKFNLGPGFIILLWIVLHISKITFSLPGGILSDRFGRRLAIVLGWSIYIAVYITLAFISHLWLMWLMIIIYGCYYGMTEGAERALIADFVPSEIRGKAYGLYHGAVGISALPASFVFGVFWTVIGPKFAFLTGGTLAALATVILCISLASKTNSSLTTS